jgi:hypothetical protein
VGNLKFILVFAVLTISVSWATAQGDLPTARPIIKGAEPNKGIQKAASGSLLKMPSVLSDGLMKDSKGPEMLQDNKLKSAGFDLVIDPRVAQSENANANRATGDVYLGDVSTRGEFVGIAIRDHGEIDGDRILIIVNDQIVEYNVLLSGRFVKLDIPLKDGFNTIEFKALNQGYVGLNTAQVIAVDENGEVIHNNNWMLSTGATAKIVIVKKPKLND